MRLSEKSRNNNNNSDNPLTSRRTDGGKNGTNVKVFLSGSQLTQPLKTSTTKYDQKLGTYYVRTRTFMNGQTREAWHILHIRTSIYRIPQTESPCPCVPSTSLLPTVFSLSSRDLYGSHADSVEPETQENPPSIKSKYNGTKYIMCLNRLLLYVHGLVCTYV